MDIVSRARNIIVRPHVEWPIIEQEPASVGDLYTKYLMPLGLIGPIASFIGLTIVGVSIPFIGTYRTPLLSGLVSAAIGFAAVLVGVYVWALIIDALAPTFGGRRDLVAALKVAVFAATPALLAGILSLLPALAVLQVLAAVYGLYLLYRGLPVLMKTPPEKAAGYTALAVACGIGVGIVLGVTMTALRVTALGAYPTLGAAAAGSNEAVAQSAIAGVIGSAAGGNDESRKAAQSVAAGIIAAGKAAENAGNQAETDAKGAAAGETDAKAGAAAAAGAAAIGSFIAGGKAHVETADFHVLEAALPAAVGALARTDMHGEKSTTAGFGVSTAEGAYRGDANGLHVKITDMGNASGLMSIGKLAFTSESESDSGYEKNVSIGGRSVHEKWTAASKSSELTAFVDDRFLVEVTGDGVEMRVAENALAAVDFGKLVALRK